ncbi:hypothetical protein [Rhizobium sp. SL86]|uniref:hypothetical protein n=1 Tax=Rhizobium sp. SL86 TaxID=2995148 RepID=UPI0022755E9C|nr:hypothetical protein [Rhizobium sp. SL86]MCY1664317.1 hypothetical protein [Rhizobium sp. SL86]
MAIIRLLRQFFDWAMREEPEFSEDPLQHPELRQMDGRALADLPLGACEAPALPDAPQAAARTAPQLSRCA